MNDDGTVMRGAQVVSFAEKHGLRRISIAELIAHRQAREKLVERLGTFPVRTEWGEVTGYAYATPFDEVRHFALVHGRIGDGRDVLVRLHRANVVTDIFEGGRTIQAVLRRFAQEGRGVLVYLRDGTAGVPLTSFSEEAAGSEAVRSRQWREVGLGAQILRDLGVTSIRNIASSARAYVGLSGFGIDLLGEEPLEG
jgi:3,4-dihydroxy 2-butanone 4-phosphate synthase/GTP cyclohydrolase II